MIHFCINATLILAILVTVEIIISLKVKKILVKMVLPDQSTFVFNNRSHVIKLFRFFLLQGHFFLYFHLDKGHCLAKTGRSPIYNKVRNGRRWLCILFSLLSFKMVLNMIKEILHSLSSLTLDL